MSTPYSESAQLYDRIYSKKDYQVEAETVRAIVERIRPGARRLDVGCGTGGHLAWFARWFEAEGVDASADMVAVARAQAPERAAPPMHHLVARPSGVTHFIETHEPEILVRGAWIGRRAG